MKRKCVFLIMFMSILLGVFAGYEKVEAKTITNAKAKKIALKKAKVKSSKATFTKVRLEYDDGIRIYDVEFYTSSKKYDYEIRASNGKILSYSIEKRKQASKKKTSIISKAKAKKIALAKVKGAKSKHIHLYLDYDDGIRVYEGTIVYKGLKYEFEINAKTGRIIEWDVESMYD